MKKQRVGIWIALLILPYILLILSAGMQFGVRLATRGSCTTQTSSSSSLSSGPELQVNDSSKDLPATVTPTKCSSDGIKPVVNMITILIGIAAVLMIMAMPLWIVMLIRASNYNKKLAQQPLPSPQEYQSPQQPPVGPQPPQYPPTQ